jgi:hypothetical protein
MIDALLDATLEGEGFAGTEDDGDNLAGLENGLDADGQSHARHLGKIIVEEAAVGQNRIVSQRLHAGTRGQARSRLVEGDMAILADAGQEQVDAAYGFDLGFICDALGLEVCRLTVEDVDVLGVDVDVGKEVLPHESVIALGVIPWDANVLVLRELPFRALGTKGDRAICPTMLKVTTFWNEI